MDGTGVHHVKIINQTQNDQYHIFSLTYELDFLKRDMKIEGGLFRVCLDQWEGKGSKRR
jgi:hypothetical protein